MRRWVITEDHKSVASWLTPRNFKRCVKSFCLQQQPLGWQEQLSSCRSSRLWRIVLLTTKIEGNPERFFIWASIFQQKHGFDIYYLKFEMLATNGTILLENISVGGLLLIRMLLSNLKHFIQMESDLLRALMIWKVLLNHISRLTVLLFEWCLK
jgi:hypothetical protein